MSYTTDLLTGLAQLLDTEGVADYQPTGAYTTDQTAIVFTVMPDLPDRTLCLNAYPVEDTHLTDAITGVQIRMRAGRDPRDLDALADAVFDTLHSRECYEVGGVRVELSWRQSQALLGQDSKGRLELTSNYYFRTIRNSPHLYE